MRVTDKHVFFWGEWPSNWYPAPFICLHEGEKHKFYNSEQYFMWMKAITFGDTKMADLIEQFGANPKTAKAMGRKVANYDDKVWNEKRYSIMLDANLMKFGQNEDIREKLLSKEFEGKSFVESSPTDQVWGVGLHESDPLIDDEKNWKGQNLLGKVLNDVRNILLKEK